MFKNLKNEKGFSILEILAAITIISIIMAIAAPNFFNLVEKSKDKSDIATANTIGKAMELYINEEDYDSSFTNAKVEEKSYDKHIQALIDEGFLSEIKEPQNKEYEYWNTVYTKDTRKIEVYRYTSDTKRECLYENVMSE